MKVADDEEDAVSLVRLAGLRSAPPAECAAAVRAHVHAAWRAGVRRRRMRLGLLVAVGAMAGAGLVMLGRLRAPDDRIAAGPSPRAILAARLEVGAVQREDASGWSALALGEPVAYGRRVRTGVQGAALRVGSGRSVRLGAETCLRWVALDRLVLEAGVVYVDSGRNAAEASPFEVETAWGAVRETGTQFEVRLEKEALRVRVREGRVVLLDRGSPLDVTEGGELRVDAGGASRRSVPVHGPEWSWVLALAPSFEMEGRPVHDLLAWSARESGWQLRYADAASRARAGRALLHGSIRGLRPDQALDAVVPATGLTYAVQAGVLRIGPAGEPR